MKFYNLLLEILDDKVFLQKLSTMPQISQNKLMKLIEGLSEDEKSQFKSLLNKYSSPSQLEAPKSDLELKIDALYGRGENIGPGEVLFHLQLKNSSMTEATNHDLTIGSEVWEVKRVKAGGGPFRPGKKGKITKFKFAGNLFKMISYLDKVTEMLPSIEDDIKDISPKLLSALNSYNTNITAKYTPREAIMQGELSVKVRSYIIKTVNTIKKEIEKNTDDEFTTVKFSGIGIPAKNKSIEPVKIDQVDGDTITLDFIGKDVIKILDVLNEFPYLSDGDFEGDLANAVGEVLEDFPSLIIYSTENSKIAIIPKDRVKDEIGLASISQNDIRLKVKPEFWN